MGKYPQLYWDDVNITYNNINRHLDKLQEMLVLKFNLLNLFQDQSNLDPDTYTKLSNRILDIMPYASVAVYIFNNHEEYELSQKIYEKMRDIYVYGFSRMDGINRDLEEEYHYLFSETINNIEEALNDNDYQ